MEFSYRKRLYDAYVQTQVVQDRAAVDKQLRSRGHYLSALIRRWAPSDRSAHILDLGCGHGAILYFFQQAGYQHLEGVDVSPQQVQTAHALGLSQVTEGDVLQTLKAKPDNSYDFLIAYDVLEHQTKDEIIVFLDEARRILTKGGGLLLHVPNGEGIFGSRVRFQDFTHETAFTPQSIRQLAGTCGYRSVEVAEEQPAIHGPVSLARALLWKIVRSFYALIHMAETGYAPSGLVLSQNLIALLHK